MNFNAWNIRQPIPSVLLFVILLAAGLASFKALKIQNFPEIDVPIVTITAVLPGVTPSQLEAEVTRKIEDSVANIGSVSHINSLIKDGVSVTTVEFDTGSTVQESMDDVRDAIVRVRSDLPSNLQPPIVSRVNIAGDSLITFAIASSTMDDTISPGLLIRRLARRCCRSSRWKRCCARAASIGKFE